MIRLFFLLLIISTKAYAGLGGLIKFASQDGFMSNHNSPLIIKDQMGGYMTGGSLLLRGPRPKELNPIMIQTPRLKYDACTGSGDFRFGAMSYISAAEFSNFLKGVAKASGAYLVKMSIKTACPQCEDIMTYLETVARDINSLTMNQCSMAQALTNGAVSKLVSSEKQRCMMEANAYSQDSDMFATTTRCQAEVGTHTSQESKEFEDMLGSEFNLVWKALGKNTESDTNFKELMMSVSGTIIVKRKDERFQFLHKPSLLQNKDLLEKFIGTNSGNSKIQLYICDERTKCLNPAESENILAGDETLYGNISKIIRALVDKVKNDDPNLSDEEEALLSFSTIPILHLIETELSSKSNIEDIIVRLPEFIEVICYDVITNYMQIILSRVLSNVQNLENVQIDPTIIRHFLQDAENIRKTLRDAKFSAFQKLQMIMQVKENLRNQVKEFEFKFSKMIEYIEG